MSVCVSRTLPHYGTMPAPSLASNAMHLHLVRFVVWVTKWTRDASALRWRPERGPASFRSGVGFLPCCLQVLIVKLHPYSKVEECWHMLEEYVILSRLSYTANVIIVCYNDLWVQPRNYCECVSVSLSVPCVYIVDCEVCKVAESVGTCICNA